MNSADTFPEDVVELQAYFKTAAPDQAVRAVPGAGADVPIWLLGSSLFSAQLAAALGLPFAFASHFAPDDLEAALALYRRQFRPSENLAKPHAMAAIGVFAADTDEAAARLVTSQQLNFLNLRRGRPGPLPPPVDTLEGRWTPAEKAMVAHAFREGVVGSRETVRRGIEAFLRRTAVDELMITAAIYDHAARVRSFEIVAEVRDGRA
jgi:luciferase family oxidoreductase group 1